jgi:hypothetical protein
MPLHLAIQTPAGGPPQPVQPFDVMQVLPLPHAFELEHDGLVEQKELHPHTFLPSTEVKQKQFVLEFRAQFVNPTVQLPGPGQCLLTLASARPGIAPASATPATVPPTRRRAVRRPIFSSARVLVTSSNQFAIVISLLIVLEAYLLYFSTAFRNVRNLPHQYKSNNNSLLTPTYRQELATGR